MTDLQLVLFGNDSEMADTEREAIVADSLAQHTDLVRTAGALLPKPCICEHPLLFAAELGEGRCGLCGRQPRGPETR